jgi:electron transport complex protein RnfC
MIETPELLIEGLKVVLALFKNAKGIIAIEDNKRDVIVKMKELVKGEPELK